MRQHVPRHMLRGIRPAIVLIGPAGGLVSPYPVAATTLLDSADHTPVYPNQPDPVVWSVSSQGSVTQVTSTGGARPWPSRSTRTRTAIFVSTRRRRHCDHIYNLSTQGLSTGTWTLQLAASGDPVAHSVQLDLR